MTISMMADVDFGAKYPEGDSVVGSESKDSLIDGAIGDALCSDSSIKADSAIETEITMDKFSSFLDSPVLSSDRTSSKFYLVDRGVSDILFRS